MERAEFYILAKALVDDAFAFQETELGKDMDRSGAPGRYHRHIQLYPRRAIGKTYAATRLANDFQPTLMVFPTRDLLVRAVHRYGEQQYYPTNSEYAFRSQQILDRGFLPTLGSLGTPGRFKLGIIDDGLKTQYDYGDRAMDELRHVMLSCCDVVLELG